MHKLLATSLALALAAPCSARADTASDLSALRQEIESMRAAYEARLQALEQRLRQAEAAAAAPPPAATVAGGAAPAAPEPARSADAAPAVVAAGGGSTGFNPSISLILSGLYTRTSRDPANYSIGGFPLPPGAEIGPGTRGLSLTESELGFAASIDPWLRGAANISLHADDSVSVEEAYVQTTSIGNGLSLKAGRFFSGVGYLNPQHSHTWDFVDNPLAYQAMLGTQYGDDGVQLTWLAPTDQYVEIGVELGRGRTFPGDGASRNGVGMASLFAHTGGDIGDSHSWRAGLSVLNAKANAQDLLVTKAASAQIESRFTGRTRVWIADAIWKWSPHGNATRTNFKLQGEYLRSTRSGSLVDDVASAPDAGRYRVVQSGWYLQGIYQFVPHWRIGLRTERLDSGNPDHDPNATAFAATDDSPRKNSLMIDYSPSEFSRVRLQLARDRARADGSDNQIFLQYQMSLGAHGAHSY